MSSDQSTDESSPMSTIEKAAARLAASAKRDVPGAGAEVRSHAPQPEDRGRPYEGGMQPVVSCQLDLGAIAARGFLVPGGGRSALAQQMRRLKRPLLLRVQRGNVVPGEGPPPNLIMVTSCLPGEGKTFTAVNLAMSMATEVEQRVLLVDADPSRGDVSHQLGLPLRPGLTALLQRGESRGEDEVLQTSVERLSVLPSGAPLEHVDELYASSTMASLVHGLAVADPDRIVIFDSAPLLATTESSVLARLMGQIVLVVEANRTPRDAVARAMQLLDGCANVSLVLNKSRDVDSARYGYGYGAFAATSERNG